MLKKLESVAEWNDLFKSQQHFFVFKHSNMCPISAEARKRVVEKEDTLAADVYEVTVQKHRDVSNKITRDLKVKHESPQLIEVKNYGIVASYSHGKVLPD